MFNKQLYKRILTIGVSVVLLALSVFGGVACDAGVTETETAPISATATDAVTVATTETVTDTASQAIQSGAFTSASSITYNGVWSLEEEILWADVIAVVDLISVDRRVDVRKFANEILYYKTLEFTFQVEQYLKGSGEDQVVGIVFGVDYPFDTRLDAANLGKDVDPERKIYWDDREAVVFLRGDDKDSRISREAGRYELSVELSDLGEQYSIANQYYRPWLPAVSSETGEQRFLLESDLNPNVPSPQTIALDELKARISAIDKEIDGRSDEYKKCVRLKYEWERTARFNKESALLYGEVLYQRTDADVGSGMPQGAKVYTSRLTSFFTTAPPGEEAEYVLAGSDQEYFVGAHPGEIFTARPLPAGEYRIYHALIPYRMHICGATVPEDAMRKRELFVDVSAPEGTLHEAFFDPVEDGKAVVAAGGANGVLEPATFSDANGASVTIRRIAWEAEAGGVGTVKLLRSPNADLTGHTLQFIGLDGSVLFSLAVADAQVDAANGTLTWKLAEQPWQSGDKLMLRVSAPVS